MIRVLQGSALALALGAGLLLAPARPSAAEPAAKDTESPAVEDAVRAGRNVELIATAFTLREHGWGRAAKKGERIEGGHIESLLTAARLLREVPAPRKLTAEGMAGKEKGTTGEALPPAEAVDLRKQSKEILERARKLVEQDVADPKHRAAYELLLADVEKLEGPRPERGVRGGPKGLTRTLEPGRWHTHEWDWDEHLPGVVAYSADARLQAMVFDKKDTAVIYGMSYGPHGSMSFQAGGAGRPSGKSTRVVIRLMNYNTKPVRYQLFAN